MVDAPRPLSAEESVDNAATNAQWLGAGFAILGLITIVGAWNPAARLASHLLLIADTLVLIGPGVWYFVAAPRIRQLDVRAVRNSQYVIFGQIGAIVLLTSADLFINGFTPTTLILPGVFALGAIPALVVLIVDLRQTRKAISKLSPPGRGFEVVSGTTVTSTDPRAHAAPTKR